MPETNRKAGNRSSDTRERLVVAAEQLFGDRGIHAVTLKEINAAAGQRNESALHYHFGSKKALIEAILRQRADVLDARRSQLLDDLGKADGKPELRLIVQIAFQPIFELLKTKEGVRFVRFVAQVLGDPQFDLPRMTVWSRYDGLTRVNILLAEHLKRLQLPAEIAEQRQRFMLEMALSALAIWTRRHDALKEVAARDFFIENLIDGLLGMLTAPVSKETQAVFTPAKKLKKEEKS